MIPTITPTWKQHLAWIRLRDAVTEFILFGGGAGGGKSWLGCEWLLTCCIFYPGTRYFIGRSELKQIRLSTVPTFYKVLKYHGIQSENLFRFNQQDNCFLFHNGSRIDFLELKYYPSDPLYERFGSFEFTAGWGEEVGEVSEDAIIAVNSRTGRCMNDKYGLMGKVLLTCNPKKNWLYYTFYIPDRDKKLSADKAFIKALVTDNDKGESGYKKKLDAMKGIQGMRLRHGIWEYDNDPASLIETEAINAIFRESKLIKDKNGRALPPKRITVDVARLGDDSTVIGVWYQAEYGWHIKLYRYIKLKVPQVANKVRAVMTRYNIPSWHVVVDADGLGGGVVDLLDSLQFLNGAKPFPAPVNPMLDENGVPIPENYVNLKSQCSYRTADKINNGTITIEICLTGIEGTTIESEKQRITEELEQVKQADVDTEGKRAILNKAEIKKILARSPDYWDTVMMGEYFELENQIQIWAY